MINSGREVAGKAASQPVEPAHEQIRRSTAASFFKLYGYEINDWVVRADGTIRVALAHRDPIEMTVEVEEHIYDFSPPG